MRISIALGHPQPGSFNHAIAARAIEGLKAAGHDIYFHDLYAEGFDPVLPAAEIAEAASLPADIAVHCEEIRSADGIIIVHPNWWGQPPAVLKGWVDRVIRPGVAYRFVEGDKGEGIPVGLLKASAALVFNTANTPADREQEVFGDPLERLWKDCIFNLCGVSSFHREMFSVLITSSLSQRRVWLDRVADTVEEYFPGN